MVLPFMAASAELRTSTASNTGMIYTRGIGEEREGREEKGTGHFNWPVMDTMEDYDDCSSRSIAIRSFIGERASELNIPFE